MLVDLFYHDFRLEKKWTARLLLVYLAALVTGVLLFTMAIGLSIDWLYWVPLLISLFVVLLTLLAGLWLRSRYFSLNRVKEKQTLEQRSAQLNTEISRRTAYLTQLKSEFETIHKNQALANDKRQAAYHDQVHQLDAQISKSREAEKNELVKALETLQTSYINAGMRSASLFDASIAGIGPKFKEKLLSAGIRTAADVSTARILNIPGFGEAKASAVDAWRAQILTRVHASRPTRLPENQEHEIRQKHNRLQRQLEEQKVAAKAAFEADLARIRLDADQREKTNQAAREKTQAELIPFKKNLIEVKHTLKEFAGVTIWNFLAYCMPLKQGKTTGAYMMGLIPLILALALGPVFQSVLALGSTASIIVVSIPTVTNTPTITPTFTGTVTPTTTGTSTLTLTPTNTLTPTITNTPTITFTPTLTATATWTNTPRPTRTHTRLPTATNAPSGGSGGDSGGPTAICNDGTYSYSQHRRGTCSHHGGVREWLRSVPP